MGAAAAAPTRSALGVAAPVPVLAIAGTTSTLDAALAERLLPVLKAVVAEVAHRGAAVVTGGTDAGIFHLLGLAIESSERRPDHEVGVAPGGLLLPPDGAPAPDSNRALVDPRLTTLVCVEGDKWGDETPMLSRVVTELAGDEPAAVLLLGGGDVARAELVEHLRRGRRVVVVEGTGRLADDVAGGLGGDDDADLRALVRAGDVRTVSIESGPRATRRAIRRVLTPPRSSRSIPARLAHRWRTRRQRWVALSVFPRWPYRPEPPGPLVDPEARRQYPLLTDRIAEAEEVIYPTFAACDTEARVEQNRYRWFTVLAIFGGLLTTVFGAVQAWLQSTEWPGVVVATLGAATTALSTVARRQGAREEYLRSRLQAERLRSVYFDHLAAPYGDAAKDGDHDGHQLAVDVARIRYGADAT